MGIRSWGILFCCFGSFLSACCDQFSTYDKAKLYHYNSAQQTNVALTFLRGCLFKGDEQILQIGSRSGRIAAYLATRVPNGDIVGIDGSNGMYSFAKRNHNKKLFPNLSFEFGDFCGKNYEDKFDYVVSFSALHWFEKQEEVLSHVHRALKKSGKVLFTIPCKPNTETSTVFEELLNKETWKEYNLNYKHPRKKHSAQEYEKFLKEAGFSSYEVETAELTHYFANKRDLIDWFSAFSPFLEQIPKNKKNAFLEDFAECYIKYIPPDETGSIPYRQKELYIKAVK